MNKEIRSFKIQEIAYNFWEEASLKITYPVELPVLEQAILAQFPISIIKLNNLTLATVSHYLNQRGIPGTKSVDESALFGFILCHSNQTFIFINGVESIPEQRFTIAHEFSHFLLDFWLPRNKLIKEFGPSICEALDGKRPFTVYERTRSLIGGSALSCYTHMLEVPAGTGTHTINVWKAEEEADKLALELLAPFKTILHLIHSMKEERSYKNLVSILTPILELKFNLPSTIAIPYAVEISEKISSGISLREKWNIK